VLASRPEPGAPQRDREAELRRALRNDGERSTQQQQQQQAAPALPPLNLPAGVLERVTRLPAEGAPAFDATKPETDHQLQQAIQLLRNMASAQGATPGGPQRRAQR
jgi:carboxyl-terminal processing protease